MSTTQVGPADLAIGVFVARAHSMARSKGFWEGQRNIGEMLALVHSELSEALEEHRAGRMETWLAMTGKPEGFGVELADAVIRLFDMAAGLGYDLPLLIQQKMDYNSTRGHKHGKAF